MALRPSFDSPVLQISHVSADLMFRGGTLNKISEPNSLDLAAYEQLSSDRHAFLA
jgi:hypothetical protein